MLKENSNLIKSRKTHFDKNTAKRIEEEKYTCIKLKKNLKSIKIDKEYFTNFVSSNSAKRYIEIKNLYKLLKEPNNKVLEEVFEVKEIKPGKSLQRLQKILIENSGLQLSLQDVVNSVRKYNHKDSKYLRLYFLKEPSKELNLLLVDIYHLAIISADRKYLLDYTNHEKDSYNLDNICKNN